eukprot:8080604-Alexandrium_andersonii.AAC.1
MAAVGQARSRQRPTVGTVGLGHCERAACPSTWHSARLGRQTATDATRGTRAGQRRAAPGHRGG